MYRCLWCQNNVSIIELSPKSGYIYFEIMKPKGYHNTQYIIDYSTSQEFKES